MKPNGFHIPRQSLMANAKQHKPAAPRAINRISVVSSVQSRIDNDRRQANRKASI